MDTFNEVQHDDQPVYRGPTPPVALDPIPHVYRPALLTAANPELVSSPLSAPYGNTGQKWDTGKTNPDLLYDGMPHALQAVIAVLDYGQAKYKQPHGWRSVFDLITRYKAASSRHDQKIRLGELKDAESGLPHRAHKIINELFVLQKEIEDGLYGEHYTEFNLPPKADK